LRSVSATEDGSSIASTPWKGEHGFLAEGAVAPAADALVQLVADALPITTYVSDPKDWWPVTGPALVARAARTLQSLMLLYDARCDLDAATLTRTLFEQLLTFAHLAHAPGERLMDYENDDLRQSEQVVVGVLELGYEMQDRDAWPSETLGSRPERRRRPSALHLAEQADREWAGVAHVFFSNADRPFRLLYDSVYRVASRAVHGTAYTTGSFADVSRPPTVVIRATEAASGAIGYEWGVWSVALMLVISSRVQGLPARGAVEAAMQPYLPASAS
jgi:hypothetical protein